MSITFNLVPSNAAASAVYVEQEAVKRGTGSPVIPHKILVFGQYNVGKSPTDNVAQLILNKTDAWDRYGRGSLLSAMIEKCLDESGGVPVYAMPLADAGTAATGTLVFTDTATAAGTLAVYIGGKKVSIAVAKDDAHTVVSAAIAAAINADLDLPVTAADVAGTVTLTVRWEGEAGNQIQLELNRADADETPAGLTVVVTDIGDAVAGADNPVLTTAITNLLADDKWFTEIAMPYIDATSLTAMEAAGVNAADPAKKQLFAAFYGYTGTVSAFITALDSRNSEWTTYMPVPGSPTAAYMIAAASTAIFARYQQANPGRPIKTLILPGVIAGNESMKDNNDTIVRAGGSWTVNQADGTVTIGDAVTTRTKTAAGADTTDWRFTIIIGNIQFKIYALDVTFTASPFDRAVVLADGGGRGPTFVSRPNTVKGYAIYVDCQPTETL